MSDNKIDWDYVNQAIAMFVSEELSAPMHGVPRLTFIAPLNKYRVFLSPDDELMGGDEGLVEQVHGFWVVLDLEMSHAILVAGPERTRFIRDSALNMLRQEEQANLTFWPVPSSN